jgi:hypothetical protein
VSMLSSHLALPRQGRLNQVIHIFGYLKKYHNAELVLDPSDPVMDDTGFSMKDWTTSELSKELKNYQAINLNLAD